jgi:shikimate kinase
MLPSMSQLNKIILIGFMASGKSAVAQLLAPRLGWNAHQLDDDIVSKSRLPSVSAIFKEHGELFFRDLESAVALSLRNAEKVVVATGGGIITRSSNMEALKSNGGVVVYLRTSFETITERAGDTSSRPLFSDKASALDLYIKRLPIYESFADIIVDTDDRSEDEVCNEILRHVEPMLCR